MAEDGRGDRRMDALLEKSGCNCVAHIMEAHTLKPHSCVELLKFFENSSGLNDAPLPRSQMRSLSSQAGRDYQLWLMDDGTPVPADTFDVSGSVVIVESSLQLSEFDGAAITVEPEGGSEQPTTDRIDQFLKT